MSQWRETTLGEICAAEQAFIQTGPFGSQLHAADYRETGIPVVPTEAIGRRRLKSDLVNRITPEKAKTLERHSLCCGDILFARRGIQATGLSAIVGKEQEGWLCGTGAMLLRFTGDSIDPTFVSFLLSTNESVAWFKHHAVGAVMPNLNADVMSRFPLRIPPLREQRAIASVLGALDDKIELNRRMNETLEALAQSLFKSWFVDATRFGLPKGWRETTLDELAGISGGKQLPTEECKPSGKFTVFGANGIMGYADKATHEEFVIAFGRVGAYCGSIHWSYGGAWINNNASSVVPHRWPEFVLQAMLNVDFAAMRTGSAQPFIPNSSLSAAKTIRPTDDILDSYCSIVRPLRLKQTQNEAESRTLAALRDALLPKLLSGELRVPAAA